MAPRTGEKYMTPIPKRDIELKSKGNGPVVTYYLTKEELEKMREKEGPACGLTKQALIEAIAAGESLSSVERAWKMKYNTIHTWVKKWGLKGLTPDKARELLAKTEEEQNDEKKVAESEKDGSREDAVPSAPSSEKPYAESEDIRGKIKGAGESPFGARSEAVAARIITAEVELHKEKDAEIERLREELAKKIGEKNRYREALGAAEERIDKLEQNVERLKGANLQAVALYDDNWELRREIAELVNERDVLLQTVEKAVDENHDPVNRPAHYTAGKVECIDAIEAATAGLTGGQAYNTGAAIKYLWRWSRKGGVEDLRKARWYIDRLIGEVESK